jgi:2-methylcitrate dehydratase PrpD
VSTPAFHHGGWRAERPLTVVGAQMNLAYAVAVTLLDGTALAAQFAPDRIDADDVWRLIDRTTVTVDPAFDEVYENGYNTRLRVTTGAGGPLEAFVDHPRGGIVRPLTNADVVEKFRTLTAPLVEPARAEAIEAAVLELDELDDAGELVALLAPPVNFTDAP